TAHHVRRLRTGGDRLRRRSRVWRDRATAHHVRRLRTGGDRLRRRRHQWRAFMTHIWVPRAKIIEPRRELRVTHGLCGRFKLEAERPDGQRRLLADWFPNLITNAGLNRIGTSSGWLTACAVGTGS